MDADKVMNALFEDGVYQDYKKNERKLDDLRKELKERHPYELKRNEFKEQGVIAIYQAVNQYKVDNHGLNSYLFDLGILLKVSNISKDIIKNNEDVAHRVWGFKLPTTYYAKFNPNKKGKIEKEEHDFSNLTDEEVAGLWMKTYEDYKKLEKMYDRASYIMSKSEKLKEQKFKKNKPLPCDYGSVSLMAHDTKYNMEEILLMQGEEFVIENATVNMKELNKFITKGNITQKEIDQFREVININERYVVLPTQTYGEQLSMLRSNLIKGSQNRPKLKTT